MGFIIAAAAIMVLGLGYALRAVLLVCREADGEETFFHRVLLPVPSVALSECSRQAECMFEMAQQSLEIAMGLFQQYHPVAAQAVRDRKRALDRYEEKLSRCIMQIPGCDLSEGEVLQRVKLNLTIGNIQSLGVCAVKLGRLAAKGEDLEGVLNEGDKRDLLVVSEAMGELISLLSEVYHTNDLAKLAQAQALKRVITGLLIQLKTSVVVCLKNETISADACYIRSCVYTDCEAVLEIAQRIQSGMERTALSHWKRRSQKDAMTDGEADQTALAQYAIKYSI